MHTLHPVDGEENPVVVKIFKGDPKDMMEVRRTERGLTVRPMLGGRENTFYPWSAIKCWHWERFDG